MNSANAATSLKQKDESSQMATGTTMIKYLRTGLNGLVKSISVLSVCASASAWGVALATTDASSKDMGGERPAYNANDFLNSLGVNVHVSQGYDATAYIQPLNYLGVRNIRDSYGKLDRILMLHQNTGVKVDLLFWCNLDSEISAARRLASDGALLAIEGPNEPNNFQIKYRGELGGGSNSWLPVAECQRAIYQAAKGDALLHPYPVFAVSEGGAEPSNVGLQFLAIPSGAATLMPDGVAYADYANAHNYVSSTNAKLYRDNQAWDAANPILNGAWDGLFVEYGRTWREGFQGYTAEQLQTLPRVTTETGWDSAANPGGQEVQGKVLVNTYLAQFKRGWAYTFIYELVDGEGSAGEQGLYTKNYVPKLAAKYIHNLTSILADSKGNVNPSRLNYNISGRLETIHDLLLQKSSGIFELIVWGEKVSGSNSIKVDLGQVHKIVNVYDVTAGMMPVSKYSGVASVTLEVSDHALVVEVSD